MLVYEKGEIARYRWVTTPKPIQHHRHYTPFWIDEAEEPYGFLSCWIADMPGQAGRAPGTYRGSVHIFIDKKESSLSFTLHDDDDSHYAWSGPVQDPEPLLRYVNNLILWDLEAIHRKMASMGLQYF